MDNKELRNRNHQTKNDIPILNDRDGFPLPPKKRRSKPPSLKTIERWLDDGCCKTPDGCAVEPDGICPHGEESWALILGYI